MTDFLAQLSHRPYPLPATPWVMRQTWYNLLFAHWPVPAGAMRRILPPQLEPDLFEGQAWLGIVPFGMSRVHLRFTFPVPWLSHFLELNVRTYVTVRGKPGVYFFSLDAANPLAVALARRWYKLPYFNARMKMKTAADGWIYYESQRTHRGAPSADFRARYRPAGEAYTAVRGALDHWLTERYCLYTVSEGVVYRGDIHHALWPLQLADAEIELNTMTAPADPQPPSGGRGLPTLPPILHFARSLEIVAWPIKPIEG